MVNEVQLIGNITRSKAEHLFSGITFASGTGATGQADVSSGIDVGAFKKFLLYVDLNKAGTCASIQFYPQFSPDNTNWFWLQNAPFNNFKFVDAQGNQDICLIGDIAGRWFRVVGSASIITTGSYVVTSRVEFID